MSDNLTLLGELSAAFDKSEVKELYKEWTDKRTNEIKKIGPFHYVPTSA